MFIFIDKSAKMNYFRKKSIHDIHKQIAEGSGDSHESLGKHLKTRDLASFGIAAIIGAGIFSTIGQASASGGPAVIFLFLFTALACGFAAFAYAEFASMVPVSGSAYTYSYVAFGEIIAWIIGWALIMEYAIGNITVAISWSDYFTSLLESIHIKSIGLQGIHLPEWIQMDYMTASNGFDSATAMIKAGKEFSSMEPAIQEAFLAWNNAPTLFGLHLIFDLPSLFIIVIITWLVYRGMKESRNASNAMVIVKLAIILLVIAVGIFYVDVSNWNPFAPNDVAGVLKGVSAVFFAYIGFDAISTTAEECENPQRDLPRGMMWAIIICTILYMIIALILTGMVNYKELAVGDPLAYVFEKLDLKWMSGIIAVSAVVAMASVLLVFQMGQPRIWMSMSRDGLLPKRFSKIHPRFKTPSFSTIVVGFIVAIPALFMNLKMVTDLCSIGTLFAFVLVCGGVLVLQNKKDIPRGKFKTPYLNAKYIMPLALFASLTLLFTKYQEETIHFLANKRDLKSNQEILDNLTPDDLSILRSYVLKSDSLAMNKANNDVYEYYSDDKQTLLISTLKNDVFKKDESFFYNEGFSHFSEKIPTWIFILFTIFIAVMAFIHNLSLIPILGLLSCLYMMSELELANWIYFTGWLLIGLIIYFGYSAKNSKLNSKASQT